MTKTSIPDEKESTTGTHIDQEQCVALSPYEPTSLAEARQLAADYAKSGLVKTSTMEKTLLVMATGKELGIPVTAALRSINIIKDRPCPSADLLVGLCLRRRDICDYFDCIESTNEKATYVTRRRGRPERKYTFTLEDARRARLLDKKDPEGGASGWEKYGPQMLQHRCSAFLAREVYPDLCLGLMTDEEMRDVIDSTAAPAEPEQIQPLTPQPEKRPETPEERSARWTKELMAAKGADEAKITLDEVRKTIPDAADPERRRIVALKDARKAAGWKIEERSVPVAGELFDKAAQAAENAHERQPGEEG